MVKKNKDQRRSNINEIKEQLKEVTIELKDNIFIFSGPLTINEFSQTVKKSVPVLIQYFMKKGKMYSINHTLTEEEIAEFCLENEYEFKKEQEINASNFMEEVVIVDEDAELTNRAPIITIMGHVDHGKTTLIDFIRNSKLANKEAGGITQHVGAYQITHNKKEITFLDTPGHEAFSAMRARGASITDVVVLVVAGDDGVMPQTKEAIIHAKVAKVPIIVFVNKMDKPGVNVERIKTELSAVDIISDEEGWGGDVPFIYGSALKGEGVDKLFEIINLISDINQYKANKNRYAIGTVVESRVDKGQGPVATLIVQNGTLHPRDFVVAGGNYGKLRTMRNSLNVDLNKVEPGSPVTISGLNYTPQAGDKFFAFKDEKFAKKLAEEKRKKDKQQELKDNLTKELVIEQDGKKLFNIIIKSDVNGTAEAVKSSIAKLDNDDAKINVIRSSVGTVTRADVLLAKVSKALIVGFNVRPDASIKSMLKEEEVKFKSYSIIYKLIEDIKDILNDMKKPVYEEKVFGEATIIKVIFASKIGNIAGSRVDTGVVKRGSQVRVIRDGKVINTSKIESLQKEKNDVKEVLKGFEFGCHIKKFDDVKEGDTLEFFDDVEIKQ